MISLTLTFVAALVATVQLTGAAPIPSKQIQASNPIIRRAPTQSIGLSKRAHARHQMKEGGYISTSKVADVVSRLATKYDKSMLNYRANTGKPHPLRKAASLAKRAPTGTIPLEDIQNGLLWAGNVTVGNPPVEIPVDFDTGSSDTFFSPGFYNPAKSSAAKDLKQAFKTSFGDGSTASGNVFLDDFSVAGVKITGQAVGQSVQSTLQDVGDHGLSGMAFPILAQFKSDPWFFSAVKQKKVSSGEFGFQLLEQGALLDVGGLSKDVTFHAVDSSQGFWNTPAKLNGLAINAIIDTGTTVIVGDTATVQKLFDDAGLESGQTAGGLMAAFDCNNPPKFTFNFGGQAVTLSKETSSFGQFSDGSCAASIIGADIGIDAFIVGDSFLQNVYAAFSVDKSAVGFALN